MADRAKRQRRWYDDANALEEATNGVSPCARLPLCCACVGIKVGLDHSDAEKLRYARQQILDELDSKAFNQSVVLPHEVKKAR